MMRFWIIILVLSAIASESLAATVQVNCSSSSTVQSAINSASNGDTVQCSAAGSYTWTSAVNLPNTKYLTLDLNGATISFGSSTITLNQHATDVNRITNGTLRRVAGGSRYSGQLIIASGKSGNGGGIVLDHLTFNSAVTNYVHTECNGIGPALIHSSTFDIRGVNEFIHITPWGLNDTTGWTNTVTPGSSAALYFEDNTVNGSTWNSDDWFQTYYGGRVVVRYNTINGSGAKLDVHGNGFPSGRWWEWYNNDGTGASSGMLFCLRGGSGIIFGNTGIGYAVFVEEVEAGTDQVGRGQNFNRYPAYYFDNDASPAFNATGCAAPRGNPITQGEDVITSVSSGTTLPSTCSTNAGYWKNDAGGNWDTTNGIANDGALYKCVSTNNWQLYYTPLKYPHPARSESGVGDTPTPDTPTPPQNLRIES